MVRPPVVRRWPVCVHSSGRKAKHGTQCTVMLGGLRQGFGPGSDSEDDFSPAGGSGGLGAVFSPPPARAEQQREAERLEVMSSVRPGVRMATAVTAYRAAADGNKPEGKLGLAIIGKAESNCYQLLLYRGKQTAVAVANISSQFSLAVQQDNYASFTAEGGLSWAVSFESQDVLVNVARQVLLCQPGAEGIQRCHALT